MAEDNYQLLILLIYFRKLQNNKSMQEKQNMVGRKKKD